MLALLVVALPAPPPERRIAVVPATWDVLAVVVDSIDVPVPGLRSPRRVRLAMDDEDRDTVRRELDGFARRVAEDTGGRLRVDVRTVRVPGPLRRLSGPGPYWLGPADAAPLLAEVDGVGRADTVIVFAKIGDEAGPAVPVRLLGGAVGGDRGPEGACFAGVTFREGWLDGTGTVALHEFLHGLRWALVEVGGFAAEDLPDPDEGRAGPTCCPDAPAGDGPFADHLLSRHVTPRMCAAADARAGPAVRDGWLRGFRVEGRPTAGAWRTVTLPRDATDAVAPLPEGTESLTVVTDAPVRVTVDGKAVRLVADRASFAVSGRRLRIARAAPGAVVRFRVRAEGTGLASPPASE